MPSKSNRRLLVRALLAVATAGLAWFALHMITPAFGKLIGYANAQPPLEVVRLGAGTSDAEVQRVLRLMNTLFEYRPSLKEDTWPVPNLIQERADCWLVIFTHKIPVYNFIGFKQAVTPTAPYLYISVKKSDMTIRFGSWCQ